MSVKFCYFRGNEVTRNFAVLIKPAKNLAKCDENWEPNILYNSQSRKEQSACCFSYVPPSTDIEAGLILAIAGSSWTGLTCPYYEYL
jgi:hypothetical protein